jgi:DNA mismatch repair ATPase MutS
MSGDIASLTFQYIIQAICVLIIIYEIYSKIKAIKKESDDEHEWRMRIKKVVEIVERKEPEWDEALAEVKETRAVLAKEFNKRLDNIERTIEENHTDTEAKIQEIRTEQEFSIEIFKVILQGIGQLGGNGPVTKMEERLDAYLNKAAHE